MINVEQIIHEHFPSLGSRKTFCSVLLSSLLRSILREKDLVAFGKAYPHLHGMDFVEQVLEYFQFDFQVRLSERKHIPATGPVVIVANHPIGSLDGLSLLRMVQEIRPDVKVVANRLLQQIRPLERLILPVNNMEGGTAHSRIRAIHAFLQQGGALIMFPAGEVSRFGARGVHDTRWNPGFLRMAQAVCAPIVPIYVQGRNSSLFYSLSLFCKPLSTLWLVREMFGQRQRVISMRIGEPIQYATYSVLPLDRDAVARLFRKHLYRLGKGKPPLLKTEKPVALPENRQQLRKQIQEGRALGKTPDGKRIWLHEYRPDSPLMREVARLRELSFRAVGEGCGRTRDMDRYDMVYEHMLLWDEGDMEIVGAYRWYAAADSCGGGNDSNELYTSGLFSFEQDFNPVIRSGLELGRSFIQPRYWGTRGLDYLWHGIGAYLSTRPDIRFLFGPVSISRKYPPLGIAMIVYYYQLYYSPSVLMARARLPYIISTEEYRQLAPLFDGDDRAGDFRILKSQLQKMGYAVPPLYKQYAGLCEPGGVSFAAFNVDPAFGHCIDGLVIVDLEKLHVTKRDRYLSACISA